MSQTILIAGGGPAGLLTALGLAQAGANVTILEASASANSSPRALVYHWPVLPHLAKLGILEDCARIGFLKQDYAWHLARKNEFIQWSLTSLADQVERPYNLHLGQDKLSEIALSHLSRMANVSVKFGLKLTDFSQDDGGVTAQAIDDEGNNHLFEADWLIGADGAGSTVREKLLKLNFFGTTWPERFIATNIQCNFEKHGYSRTTMQVDDVHGAIIVKIDDDRFWRVTFMEDAALPLDSVQERIHQTFRTLLPKGEDYELIAYSPYRMHQRVSDSMRHGRVLLVGDAGHITNPTGGLGLTSGMFDAFALIEVLNRVIHGGASHDILNLYSHDRRRKFIEIASPRAAQNKLTVFHSGAGVATDAWADRMRAIAASREKMAEVFSFTKQLETQFTAENGF